LMGGCAGYTNSYIYSIRRISDIMSLIIFSGIKWGGLSFLLGILISFCIAGYIKIERSNQKQKLLRYIAFLKEKKEKEISNLNKKYQNHEQAISENYEKQIKLENERIKNISELKEKKQAELTKSIEAQIKSEIEKLDFLFG